MCLSTGTDMPLMEHHQIRLVHHTRLYQFHGTQHIKSYFHASPRINILTFTHVSADKTNSANIPDMFISGINLSPPD